MKKQKIGIQQMLLSIGLMTLNNSNSSIQQQNLDYVQEERITSIQKTHAKQQHELKVVSGLFSKQIVFKIHLTTSFQQTSYFSIYSDDEDEQIRVRYALLEDEKPEQIKFKSSETITPQDFDHELRKTKSKFDFIFLFQIGSGGFGRVWKVQQKKTKSIFAMKDMSKAKIIAKKSVSSIMNEKELLDQLNSPFLINSCGNFQDRDNLYLLMEYLRGGDLRYHMCFYQIFDQQQTRFIVGCIVLALEYIHANNIIHRDLKPENIVFQENGYARITDFGVARKKRQDNSQDTSGTPGYMSPEVICRMNHSFEADFFALGVIVYELIFGIRPYYGESRKEIRQKILAHQARIHQKQLPNGWSSSCIDFVNGLLKRNKQVRLGYNGISEIKNHPWLKPLNWAKLARKQIKPPFVPGVISQSREYQKQMQNSMPSEVDQDASILLRTSQIQRLFRNYDIVCKKRNTKIEQLQSQRLSFNKKIL